MEREIGDIFSLNGHILEVVETANGDDSFCENCFFGPLCETDNEGAGYCYNRSDKKYVIFREVKKDGKENRK